MESLLGPLLPLFDRERAAGNALAVGILVHTAGSTYRKPGALMLIAKNGDYSGLLSGGCLEGDLRQHAHSVIETGEPRIVSYDLFGPDDLLWGLGLGCEGAMRILLLRAGPDRDWQPLTHLARSLESRTPSAVGIVVESASPEMPTGTVVLPDGVILVGTPSGRAGAMSAGPAVLDALKESARTGRVGWVEANAPSPSFKLFALPLTLPPKLLILGAGPDAAPIVDFAARVNFKVTVVDHRPAYADASHFPSAESVVLARPEELDNAVELSQFSAVVVMSHHLPSDLSYLRVLSKNPIPYIGLLGPAARRQKLLGDLGSESTQELRSRLHAPVGLALGGRSPESIALSIVAEIHAFVHGANARPRDDSAS